MNNFENIKIAFSSIKDNFLRSLLTLMIIAVGITCMIGILTAIDSVLFSMSSSFNRLGANSYSFRPTSTTLKSSGGGRRVVRGEPISYSQAIDFSKKYKFGGSRVAINVFGTGSATIKYKDEESTPTIRVEGIDDNYLYASAYEIAYGRNFTADETYAGGSKCIIGSGIVDILFDKKSSKAVGKIINVNSRRYKVIGVLEEKGSTAGSSGDKRIFLPLFEAKKLYGSSRKNYSLTVAVNDPTLMDDAIADGIGTMRNVRQLKIKEKNDFEIRTSDSILEQLKSMTKQIRIGTMVIVGLTLLGAAIGLMNIMLVTVTERTKEIGVRKALGATRSNVLFQFLTEAVVICIIGGLVGILLGNLVGFVIAKFALDSTFVVPWFWMFLGIVVCITVGVVSGLYPALKASRLDPIESLRYE